MWSRRARNLSPRFSINRRQTVLQINYRWLHKMMMTRNGWRESNGKKTVNPGRHWVLDDVLRHQRGGAINECEPANPGRPDQSRRRFATFANRRRADAAEFPAGAFDFDDLPHAAHRGASFPAPGTRHPGNAKQSGAHRPCSVSNAVRDDPDPQPHQYRSLAADDKR